MLDKIRAAFDGDDVPRKNIALRKAADRIEELETALRRARDDLQGAHLGEGFQLNLRDIADRITTALK